MGFVNKEDVKQIIIDWCSDAEDDLPWMLEFVDDLPEPDLVEVVRCRECVFFGKEPEIARALGLETEFYCAIHRDEMSPDFFCSYGRKKPWGDEE